MSYLHSFGPDDILVNRMVAKPSYEFVLYRGAAYLNNERNLGRNIPTGTVSLFEYNVDRDGTNQSLIHPFIIKDGFYNTMNLGSRTVTGSAYSELSAGTQINGSYPMTSSISRHYYAALDYPTLGDGPNSLSVFEQQLDEYADARKGLISLKNTMNYYKYLSDRYAYTGSYVTGNVNSIQVPSIFFSDGIEKGSVNLKFYHTGTLIGEAIDKRKNGELISVVGSTSGSTVGVVLYNEGFILLTSSAAISDNLDDFAGAGSLTKPTWLEFGNNPTSATASLYSVSFKGIQKIPSITMFATVQAGEANNSLNPTWIQHSSSHWTTKISSGKNGYVEPTDTAIKNTVQSQYCNFDGEFQKQVFISQIGIFDEDKNLLGIAKLANPVLKRQIDNFTFKLNLDM